MKTQKWMLKEWLENVILLTMAGMGIMLFLIGCSYDIPDYMIIPTFVMLGLEYLLSRVLIKWGRPLEK